MTSRIDESLGIGSDFNAPSPSPSYNLMAFQHFMKWSTGSVGLPAIRAVMQSDMVQVAFNDALLPGVNQKNFDALISTCMFMGVMSVCPENFKPTDSWVLTNNSADMNWLCLQSGLRCLLEPAARYLPGSIWETAFKGYEEVECQLFNYDDQVGRQGLDPLFADFCDIDDLSTGNTSPYYIPLRTITTLFQLEKNMPNAARCTTFMGRLEFDFLALLRKRDPPALMILAHWMGLMCLLTEWQPWVEVQIFGSHRFLNFLLLHVATPSL
ncbi:transcription factor [Aspergillus melleus]|uniref:Transcription factor n=1 Tax=Aspergillus melleus TaxID=138277 RepID=A0ACC3AYQ0_9EURO|nr:transcription factor [Aspergillus melleus]